VTLPTALIPSNRRKVAFVQISPVVTLSPGAGWIVMH